MSIPGALLGRLSVMNDVNCDGRCTMHIKAQTGVGDVSHVGHVDC